MSLMKTLAKVAIGIAVAKGVSHMAGKKSAPQRKTGGGGLLDALTGGGAQSQQRGGGLEDMLGSLLGGGQKATRKTSGGLGGMLDSLSDASTPRGGVQTSRGSAGGLDSLLDGLMGGSAQQNSGGGIGDLLSGITKGGAAGSGDLGGLLGGMFGATGVKQATSSQSFGDKFNDLLAGDDEVEEPSAGQELAAGLMLRAMIQAAKSDGKIDDGERERLLGRLGDVSPQERDFVNAEMAADIDIRGLAEQVPNGMEAQVYAMSILGINLDSRIEAQYLHDLATEMGIDKQGVNHIHQQLGVPSIYA